MGLDCNKLMRRRRQHLAQVEPYIDRETGPTG